jgi:hypothetical protein
MKKLLFFIALTLLVISSWAIAEDNCFVVTSQEWGTYCEGKAESLSLTVTNTCEVPFVLSICMKQTDGEWQCELTDAFEPGTKKDYGICNATGDYKLAQCRRIRYCSALEEKK